MPSSPTPPRGNRGTPPKGGSSRRAAPTKVSKPFPWGTVLGSALLGLLLVGIVAYAALNQGSGIPGNISDPDNSIDGVTVASSESLTRNHVQGAVDYPSLPPSGGDHNAVPQQCAVYTEPIAPEHAVHSLEHGAVWVTYQPGLPGDQVETLTDLVDGDPYLLMSPLPDQTSPITLTAWGRSLAVDRADDERVEDFVNGYRTGPQTPEPGAACIGNTTTGPLRGGSAPGAPAAPAPAAPAAPAPAAPAPAAPAPAAPVVPAPAPS